MEGLIRTSHELERHGDALLIVRHFGGGIVRRFGKLERWCVVAVAVVVWQVKCQ